MKSQLKFQNVLLLSTCYLFKSYSTTEFYRCSITTVYNATDPYALQTQNTLEMWTNAQCDGHPAEYRWCPLFNAAKFG